MRRLSEAVPQVALLHDDRDLSLSLQGAVLEAQFEMDAEIYLLLLTEDCPYEEGLHAYLLDSGFRVLDSIHHGHAYTPGILRDLRTLGGRTLEFYFDTQQPYRITVSKGLLNKHRLTLSGG